jgi:ubiquitin carboxyl-terminal hydrolase 22/27/51
MTPYTTRAKRKAKEGGETRSHKPYVYDLLSVVVHKGEINSGHYISYCRENGQVCGPHNLIFLTIFFLTCVFRQWFQFDDSMVTLATEKQVLAAQAYLLVYIIRTLS